VTRASHCEIKGVNKRPFLPVGGLTAASLVELESKRLGVEQGGAEEAQEDEGRDAVDPHQLVVRGGGGGVAVVARRPPLRTDEKSVKKR